MTAHPPPRAGRPPLDGDRALTVVQVRLSAAQIATARRLGNGNISAGVRAALDATTRQKLPIDKI